ncbi:MAG: DUF488 family protein [Xanthobacteraceae bacterium]|uniref:DUF488 domain-containing protein n=1 Tax=Pseudolabrys sp. TaxID=1960880 RepID=UPI003D1299D9
MPPAFFTIGHSNRTLEAFIALLKENDIGLVADIRQFPRSRTNPQFNIDTLPAALVAAGVAYEHMTALGGRRPRTPGIPPDLNGFWTNDSFHHYADYALSEEFRTGLEHLREAGAARTSVLMCSEAVWWRCHRRIVTDYLIAGGSPVFHVMGEGRLEPARLTAGAVTRPDGTVVYPAAPESAAKASD